MLDLSAYKSINIDGMELKRLEINGTLVWEKGYTNWVPLSINADGNIYNGGLGYKNGYRVRSGGAETTASTASITGFIKVNGGDVVRISGCDFATLSTDNAINVSDSNFTNIGQLVGNMTSGYGIFSNAYSDYGYSSVIEEKTGVWRWVAPPAESGIAYIRVTAKTMLYTGQKPDGSTMIVTINEEIK